MLHDEKGINKKLKEVLDRLSNLEKRVSIFENNINLKETDSTELQLEPEDIVGIDRESEIVKKETDNHLIEYEIGKYSLIWIGNIVLSFGLVFLTQYIYALGHAWFSSIVGFISVAMIFGFSCLINKSLPYIALMFRATSLVLLYYFTVRLHFFMEAPLLPSKWMCLILLLTLNVGQYYLSIRIKSKMYGFIALVLSITTAILSNSTHFMLTITTITAFVALYYFFLRLQWRALLIVSLGLVYFSIFMWFMSNPIMGNSFHFVKNHQYSLIYLLAVAAIYTFLTLAKKGGSHLGDFIFWTILLNGINFTFLLIIFVVSFFPTDYSYTFLLIFIICYCTASIQKYKSDWEFASPLYALYGFIALSVAVSGYYKFPGAFLMLSIESLLVVSVALWFRSKFIVLMNMLMYLILLITYLSFDESGKGINFAFAIVAFISARILNWKKDRLEIKTEFLRSTYLLAGFIMLLYALYAVIPTQYLTLSWTGTAVLYFGMSIILKNQKYRWLSIATFIVTAFHLVIVDLGGINMVNRIIAFMALAIISIIISIIYAKKKNISK